MPIDFAVVPEHRLIHVQLHETISLEGIRDLLVRRAADPRFDPSFRRLVDARRLTDLPSGREMSQIAELVVGANPARAPIAFVADRDVVYGMFRMLEIISELQGCSHRVFRTMREAREWFGLPEEMDLESLTTAGNR